MKKTGLAFSILFVAMSVLAVLLVRSDRTVREQQRALRGLSDKVERLEQRRLDDTKQLARTVMDNLDSRIKEAKTDKTPFVVAPPQTATQVPSDWVPFQFNGMTYYQVPLVMKN